MISQYASLEVTYQSLSQQISEVSAYISLVDDQTQELNTTRETFYSSLSRVAELISNNSEALEDRELRSAALGTSISSLNDTIVLLNSTYQDFSDAILGRIDQVALDTTSDLAAHDASVSAQIEQQDSANVAVTTQYTSTLEELKSRLSEAITDSESNLFGQIGDLEEREDRLEEADSQFSSDLDSYFEGLITHAQMDHESSFENFENNELTPISEEVTSQLDRYQETIEDEAGDTATEFSSDITSAAQQLDDEADSAREELSAEVEELSTNLVALLRSPDSCGLCFI